VASASASTHSASQTGKHETGKAGTENSPPSGMKKRRARRGICERFGFAVKLRREDLGLTQEDLAEKASIHRTYLSDIERGTRNVSLINIELIAKALSQPFLNFFGRSSELE
jgi:ribosome-binding protein aMBF1 (putative translation factor)